MTTTDWLRSRIGPSPHPAPPERIVRNIDPATGFFTGYLRPEMRVLHVYCGAGKRTLELAEHVPVGEVIGADPHLANLRAARARNYVSSGGGIKFERASIENLPFGDAEFDAVLLDHALSATESPERALRESLRVLVPGGLLGTRNTVSQSRVFTAESPLLQFALAQRDEVLRDLGGDPDMGTRQPRLLREAGFVNLRVTSSTDQKTEDDLLEELARDGHIPPREDASEDDESPAIISFVIAVETVCWKPA